MAVCTHEIALGHLCGYRLPTVSRYAVADFEELRRTGTMVPLHRGRMKAPAAVGAGSVFETSPPKIDPRLRAPASTPASAPRGVSESRRGTRGHRASCRPCTMTASRDSHFDGTRRGASRRRISCTASRAPLHVATLDITTDGNRATPRPIWTGAAPQPRTRRGSPTRTGAPRARRASRPDAPERSRRSGRRRRRRE